MSEVYTPVVEAKSISANEHTEKIPQAISLNSNQGLVAKDNSELMRMILTLMKGQAFPKTLDTSDKVIAAWQMAASLSLPPAVCLQNMAVIHGSVCIWGQLPAALAERTGQIADRKLIYFDDNQTVISLENKNLTAPVWGAVVQMRRAQRSMNEYFFTEIEAKTAGLFGKPGPWKDYRKIMYARRTFAHAYKFEFADALMGVPVAEYDFHEAPDLKDVSNNETVNDVNEIYTETAATN